MKSQDAIGSETAPTASQSEDLPALPTKMDLDACPGCGEPAEAIILGRTNCPRCGLHFECC